jgi:hypothetical protein
VGTAALRVPVSGPTSGLVATAPKCRALRAIPSVVASRIVWYDLCFQTGWNVKRSPGSLRSIAGSHWLTPVPQGR